ncbi:hypothetical protein F1880_005433 [Penicillium rolfsii]|nr:hypothetical protein F1880_005433 [Penicillium rolfsii]
MECQLPGCAAGYSRKEHLVRHEAQHSQRQSFPCPTCSREFRRSDTLRRHMRHNHGVDGPTQIKQACASCRKKKSRCRGGSPCSECRRRGIHCSLDGEVEDPHPQAGKSDIPPPNAGCSEPVDRFLDLFFEKFHPYWLFVHRGSFNKDFESPLLVQAMVVIGLWTSEEPNNQSAAIDLHNTLASAIHQQRETWDFSNTGNISDMTWPIPTYQGILLHVIFALMHAGAKNVGIDLRPSLSPTNTNILDSLVASCKRLGTLYYPTILARYSQSDPKKYVWLGIEETKRYNLALYRVCRAVSRLGQQATATDAYNYGKLHVKDLQFPLPCENSLWKAVTKADWDSAADNGVFDHVLDDTMDTRWISNISQTLDDDWDLNHVFQG